MTQAAAQQNQQKKMTLQAVTKGKLDEPIRCAIWGPAGLGKTTFAAQAPSPIFLPTEDGTSQLDVARFPKPESFQDCRDAVRELLETEHDFRTLVIDSVTHMEPLVFRAAIDQYNATTTKKVADIEGVRGGYGKGYEAAVDIWRLLLADIERLQRAKRMHVIFIGHVRVQNFKNPEGPDYERFELSLQKLAAGLIREWVDAYLFARYEAFGVKEEGAAKTAKAKGSSTGARIIHTNWTAAYDAKNRYSLPDPMPLSWSKFFEATRVAAQNATDLAEAIRRAAEGLPEPVKAEALGFLEKAGTDATKLAKTLNWVNERVGK